MRFLHQILHHRDEEAAGRHDDDEEEPDNHDAKLGTGEIAQVNIARSEGEDNDKNPTDYGNRKEKLVAEIAPHRDWGVFDGEFWGGMICHIFPFCVI